MVYFDFFVCFIFCFCGGEFCCRFYSRLSLGCGGGFLLFVSLLISGFLKKKSVLQQADLPHKTHLPDVMFTPANATLSSSLSAVRGTRTTFIAENWQEGASSQLLVDFISYWNLCLHAAPSELFGPQSVSRSTRSSVSLVQKAFKTQL